jgi:hypothetical protein
VTVDLGVEIDTPVPGGRGRSCALRRLQRVGACRLAASQTAIISAICKRTTGAVFNASGVSAASFRSAAVELNGVVERRVPGQVHAGPAKLRLRAAHLRVGMFALPRAEPDRALAYPVGAIA